MAVSFGFRAGSLALGSGGGGSEPTLITKTITENDTYNASDDNADGYSSVTVNVQSGGAQPERLVYFVGTEQYGEAIPPALKIDEGAKYSEYLSYDSTTKKFTVLKAFDAMVTCWVREYRDYYSDYSYGGFQKNGTTVCGNYRNSGQAIDSVGGTWFYLKFAVGDTFNAHSETNAYPQQHFKVYLLDLDMPSNFIAFADEEA